MAKTPKHTDCIKNDLPTWIQDVESGITVPDIVKALPDTNTITLKIDGMGNGDQIFAYNQSGLLLGHAFAKKIPNRLKNKTNTTNNYNSYADTALLFMS